MSGFVAAYLDWCAEQQAIMARDMDRACRGFADKLRVAAQKYAWRRARRVEMFRAGWRPTVDCGPLYQYTQSQAAEELREATQ